MTMTPEMMMCAKVDARVLRAVSRFASKEETRYYLNGVRVEIQPRSVTYIATDGHTLFVRHDKIAPDDVDNDLTGNFTIPTAQCQILKVKKDDLGTAWLSGNSAEMSLRRGSAGVVFTPIDGDYPDWRRVLPAMPLKDKTAQFNGNLIARFTKASEELSLGLPFIAHNNEGPALVRFPQPDTLGVIMPFRSEDMRDKPLPLWLDYTHTTEDYSAEAAE